MRSSVEDASNRHSFVEDVLAHTRSAAEAWAALGVWVCEERRKCW